MRKLSLFAAIPALVLSSACYHAIIDTGRPASGQMIERPWAMSFIYGLVPPPVVETAGKCPNGIAKVETQWSFLNGLVNALTFGIVTPMDIRVSCASRGTASTAHVVTASSFDNATQAMQAATDEVVKSHAEVYVKF